MEEREEALELRDYIEIAFRRLPVMLLVFGIVMFLVVGYTITRQKVYQAIAKVRVKTQQPGSSSLISPLQTIFAYPSASLDTYLQLATSRPYLEEAVKYIRDNSRGEVDITVDEMENLTRTGNIKLEVPKGSEIILIKANSTSPEKAMWIVNGIAHALVYKNQEEGRKEAVATRKFIEEQLYGDTKEGKKGLYQRLLEAEKKLREFKEKEGIFSLEEDTKKKVERLANLQSDLEQTEASINTYKASVDYLKEQLKKEGETRLASWTLGESPTLIALRQQLVELEVKLLGLQQKYADNHPEVIATKKQIEEINGRIEREAQKTTLQENVQPNPLRDNLLMAQVDLLKAEAKREALRRLVSELESELSRLPEKEMQFVNLQRDVQVAETLYTTLQQRLQEARIAEATTFGNVTAEEMATLPKYPIYPKKGLNYALGFILALSLAVLSGALAEYFDDAIKSPADLERRCRLTPLAIIPRFENNATRLVILESHRSHASEAFRTLRSSLKFAGLGKPLKAILITSPEPSEGKSTVSANLAVAFAQAGQKTLILDADLRRPRVHEIFGLDREVGLTNLLVGEADTEEAVKPTEIDNLYAITCGPIPPNPAELLESERMREVLEELKQKFDIVIIDSPLVMGMADAVILSSICDGALIVARYNSTSRSALNQARKMLENVKANILGAVLNEMDVRRARYGGYYYYYYYYYYEEGGEKRKRRARH
ncbi:polysaccharide biosynthesis tyrosine autokinase [bacterium]|nr:polysaccharide biosynthesis tyrosine autokinase [bacterium]